MPGFNIRGSGGGTYAPNPKLDIFRSYRWQLTSIERGSGGGGSLAEYLKTYAELTVPSINFDTQSIPGSVLNYKFAKYPNFDDIDIKFYDVSGLQEYFEEWREEVWSATRGNGTDYKGIIRFEITNNRGKKESEFALHNAWPKRLSHSPMSMRDNSLKYLTASISFDWYEHNGVSSVGAGSGPSASVAAGAASGSSSVPTSSSGGTIPEYDAIISGMGYDVETGASVTPSYSGDPVLEDIWSAAGGPF